MSWRVGFFSSTYPPPSSPLTKRRFEFSATLQRNMVVVQGPVDEGGLTAAPAATSPAPTASAASASSAPTVSSATAASDAADNAPPESSSSTTAPTTTPVPAAVPPASSSSSPATTTPTLVFAKGSPEAIRALVQPDSVPDDFDATLGSFTREGLRVLALAQGDASQVGREGGSWPWHRDASRYWKGLHAGKVV